MDHNTKLLIICFVVVLVVFLISMFFRGCVKAEQKHQEDMENYYNEIQLEKIQEYEENKFHTEGYFEP